MWQLLSSVKLRPQVPPKAGPTHEREVLLDRYPNFKEFSTALRVGGASDDSEVIRDLETLNEVLGRILSRE